MTGLAFRRGLAAQGVGPARDGARPLLGGAQCESGLDLLRAGGLDGLGRGVADLGVRLVLHRFVLGDGELLLRRLQGEQRVGAAGLDLVAARAEALCLRGRRPDGLLERPEPGGRPRAALFRGALLALGRFGLGPARGLLGARTLQRGQQTRDLLVDAPERGGGVVDGGLDVEGAAARAGAARRPVRAEHVAVGRDSGPPGRDDQPGGLVVGHEDDPTQQRPHRGRDRTVPGHRRRRPPRPRRPGKGGDGQAVIGARRPVHRRGDVRRGGRPFRCRIRGRGGQPVRRCRCAAARHQQGCPAARVRPEGAEGGEGSVEVGHGQAVGELAQGRGHRCARLGLDGDQGGHRAQHPVGVEERRGAVAPGQPDRERLHPRVPVRPLPFRLPLARHELRDPPPRHLVGLGGVGAAVVQRGVALGEGAELVAGGGQLGLRGGGAFLRLDQRVGEPLDLLRRGRRAAAQRLGASGERRKPGAPVGEGAEGGQVRPLRRGQRALVRRARLRDLQQRAPGRHYGGDQHLLLLGDRLGLGVELVGIPAGGARLARRGEMAGALLGQAHGPREPLGQRRQAVPGVLGGGQARRVLRERRLQPLLLDPPGRELRLHLGAPGAGARLVGLLLRELVPQRDQVVGGQPQPGVAQLGLHGLGAARDLGLPAERLELAAQLGGEVGEPGEVGLHRVELAERLLLALAVLEDARGLLDEGAPVLRLATAARSRAGPARR